MGLVAALVTADWTATVPVRVWAGNVWSVAPPCPDTLTWSGMRVIPPLSLAIPACVRGWEETRWFTKRKQAGCETELTEPNLFTVLEFLWTFSEYLPPTLHRDGECLPIVSSHGGGSHGDHALSGCDGRDEAGLVDFGQSGRCRAGGADTVFGGGSKLAVLLLHKQPSAKRADRWRTVAVQQSGGWGRHAWRGEGVRSLMLNIYMQTADMDTQTWKRWTAFTKLQLLV